MKQNPCLGLSEPIVPDAVRVYSSNPKQLAERKLKEIVYASLSIGGFDHDVVGRDLRLAS